MSSNVPYSSDGSKPPRQLTPRTSADEVVTEDDVQQPPKLARLLGKVLRELAALRRAWRPREVYFEDYPATDGGTIRLEHRLGGRVRWCLVDFVRGGTGTSSFNDEVAFNKDDASTTSNVLVLNSRVVGTASFRVWEAG